MINTGFINEKKLKKCVDLLKEYFSDKNEELAEVTYPSCLEFGGEVWLYYVFFSCLLDYGMRSKIYHKNLLETYKICPQIFNPKCVVDTYCGSEEELLRILKEYVHPRYPNVALSKWVSLSKELAQYENIKEVITGFRSFSELNQFIRNMHGYGQKTGGLLIRVICDAGICNFVDELGVIPLDRHDVEVCFMTGIINKSKLNDKEIEALSTSLIKFGKSVEVSASNVDKYLWEIGNRFCNKKNCIECPLHTICKTKGK